MADNKDFYDFLVDSARLAAELKEYKVANFAYTQKAYEENDIAGYDGENTFYEFDNENNIPAPVLTLLDVNQTVLDKGYRNKATTPTRNMLNHIFGRVSYNLNKLIDIVSDLLTYEKDNFANIGSVEFCTDLESLGISTSEQPVPLTTLLTKVLAKRFDTGRIIYLMLDNKQDSPVFQNTVDLQSQNGLLIAIATESNFDLRFISDRMRTATTSLTSLCYNGFITVDDVNADKPIVTEVHFIREQEIYTTLQQVGLKAGAPVDVQKIIDTIPADQTAIFALSLFNNSTSIFEGLDTGYIFIRKKGTKGAMAILQENREPYRRFTAKIDDLNRFKGWLQDVTYDTIDDELNDTSVSPVQNKVIKAALDTKKNKTYTSLEELGLTNTATIDDVLSKLKIGETVLISPSYFQNGAQFKNITQGLFCADRADTGYMATLIDTAQGAFYYATFSANKFFGWVQVIDETNSLIKIPTATEDSNGLLSAADKKSLDSIAKNTENTLFITDWDLLGFGSSAVAIEAVIKKVIDLRRNSGKPYCYCCLEVSPTKITEIPNAENYGLLTIESTQTRVSLHFADKINSSGYDVKNYYQGECTVTSAGEVQNVKFHKIQQVYTTIEDLGLTPDVSDINVITQAVPFGASAILNVSKFTNAKSLFNNTEYGWVVIQRPDIVWTRMLLWNNTARKYFIADQNASKFYSWIEVLTTTSVDSALSSTSTNPVQNKVINTQISTINNNITSINNRIDSINTDLNNTLTASSVVDNVTSTAKDKPLSANQGKLLNDRFANFLPLAGGTMTGTINSSLLTGTYQKGNQGVALINSTAAAGQYVVIDKTNSTHGYFTRATYQKTHLLQYTEASIVDTDNKVTKSVTLLDEDGNCSYPGNMKLSGNLTAGGSATITGAISSNSSISGGAITGSSITSNGSITASGSVTLKYGVAKGSAPSSTQYREIVARDNSTGSGVSYDYAIIGSSLDTSKNVKAYMRAYHPDVKSDNAEIRVEYVASSNSFKTYAPNPPSGDSSNWIATTSYVQGELGGFGSINSASSVSNIKVEGFANYIGIRSTNANNTHWAFVVSQPIYRSSIIATVFSRAEFTWIYALSGSKLTISGTCYSGTDPNNLTSKTNAEYTAANGKTVFIVNTSTTTGVSLSLNSYTSPPPTWMFVGYNCAFGG